MRTRKKKKKVDRAALNSAFMRIPGMRVEAARDLLDLGFREIYELQGRAPETILADLRKIRAAVPDDRLSFFRLATHFSENHGHTSALLTPKA